MEILRDYIRELRVVSFRLKVFTLLALFLTVGLIVRLVYLQVMRYQDMASQSDENRIDLRIVSAPRGLIYDTNGSLLAFNRPSRLISIVKERVEDMEELLKILSELIEVSDWDLKRFHQDISRVQPFSAVPLRFDLNDKESARVAVNLFRLPGVEMNAESVRYYPEGELCAHSVGYVGRVTAEDMQKENHGYQGDYNVGKTGLEKYYELSLMGKAGYKEVETNARGRVVSVLRHVEPKSGKNLHLYLNVELQKKAMKIMSEYRGAVVLVDPKTGGILSMVSTPSFDPNLFVMGIELEKFRELQNNVDKPLYNRATLGEYPPASTIKPIIGLGLLEHGIVTSKDEIYDNGWYQLPNNEHKFRNWKREGHGWVDLEKAIIVSNDSYFYHQATKVGIDWIHEAVSKFGLGKTTGIDIEEERLGLVPSKSWKRGEYGKNWYSGETVIAIIGQGYTLVTPIQLAAMAVMIANRGKYVSLKLAKEKEKIHEKNRNLLIKKAKHWDFIIGAMEKVVMSSQGTAHWRIGRGLKYRMAGKTGTAQVVSIAQGEEYNEDKLKESEKDHSLFIAFAPVNDPEIVISVIIENGSGATVVARKLMDFYLSLQEKKSTSKLVKNTVSAEISDE